MPDHPPIFASFDDAWSWFAGGGQLESIADRRERFLRGRAQLLTFQVPVAGTDAEDAIVELQDALADVPGLDLMPPEVLHISLRAVGFQVIARTHDDDVLREEVPTIGERAARALKSASPFEVTLGPINVFPDALILEVHDDGSLSRMRDTLAVARTGDAFGVDAAHFLPHCTVAMFSDPVAAAPALRDALPALRSQPPITLRARAVDFVRWWFTGLEEAEWPELDVVRSYRLRG